MEDFFFDDGAVEVIHAVGEGDLGEGESHADPVGGDVGNVVQVDASDGEVADFLEGGGAGDALEAGASAVGFEGEGDESGEAVGFILELAQEAKVVDAVVGGFDVAMEHGAGAAPSELVPGAVDFGPFFGCFFALADLVTDFRVEDFCSAAGDGTEAMVFEEEEGVADGFFEDSGGEVSNFDRGEGFDD